MNSLDVAGLLKTCSEKCAKTTSKEKLQELIRDLKKELSSKEIQNFSITDHN